MKVSFEINLDKRIVTKAHNILSVLGISKEDFMIINYRLLIKEFGPKKKKAKQKAKKKK
jgi:nitrogen regulatory protein PII-like uncharacterized protein